MWVSRMDVGLHAWWQVPLPSEQSWQQQLFIFWLSCLFIFKCQFLGMGGFAYMNVCSLFVCRCQKGPEEGTGSPGTGLRGHVDAGN